MAVTVRINEDNYVSLKQLAEKERRSVVAQLDVILDEYFKRDTVGIFVASESDLDGTPIQNTPLPKNTEAIKLESTPVAPNPLAGIFNELPDADDIRQSNAELECCQHPTRPCKHWVWDTDSGEGYKNTLSGRFREAD